METILKNFQWPHIGALEPCLTTHIGPLITLFGEFFFRGERGLLWGCEIRKVGGGCQKGCVYEKYTCQ